MKISDENWAKIQDLKKQGFIKIKKNPYAPMYLVNHTDKVRYMNAWNNYTIEANGYIVDDNRNILERPFHHIFDHDSCPFEIPKEQFIAYQKLDGAQVTLYFLDQEPFMATKSSFTSPTATKATEVFRKRYRHIFDSNNMDINKYTYVFEFISPLTKVIVDYKGEEDLVLIAKVDKETGKEEPIEPLRQLGFRLPVLKQFSSIQQILAEKMEDIEGYVVTFQSGIKLNVKNPSYRRLFKLYTTITDKSIWMGLLGNIPYSKNTKDVPERFHRWIEGNEQMIKDDKKKKEDEYRGLAKLINSMRFETSEEEKKMIIFQIQQKKFKDPELAYKLITAILKNENSKFNDLIWKIIKPTKEHRFIKVIR